MADVVLEPLRRGQSSEGLAMDLAYVEFFARARINGGQVFPQRHSRFMIATFVSRMLNAPLDDVEAAAPLLEASARRLHDSELAAAVRAFAIMRRAQESGVPAPASVHAAFVKLAEYIGTPPGPWNDGSGSGALPA